MFIFPGKKYKDYFLSNGPSDSIGIGNASGWATNDEFLAFMKHFIKHVKPSVEDPLLMLLDNHSSHLAIETINFAKNNGIIMLSFLPHCSHRLQPLDVSIFGPFKKYVANAQDGWLRSNAGKTMTICDIPKIVAETLPLATTSLNIIHGFKKTGIFPYNRKIFTDIDFAPSYVTDRPEESQLSVQAVEKENVSPNYNSPSTSTDNTMPFMYEKNIEFSPEIVKPFPKAGPRKQTQVKRKKRSAAILTSTPEKNILTAEQNQKEKMKDDVKKKK
ncbi:PREDICTED: uncharacterized protein LOC108764541, partial [Trachymyrmex cornetzi]|uniref:uncharacterized protein LOC108764541 n=1 Tax=Trachymyrmex cornetzi TaxID=471704 RepID=UPI00084F83AF